MTQADATRPARALLDAVTTLTRPLRMRVRIRVTSVDIVRGYAMIAMLISHSTRELNGFDFRASYRWDTGIVPDMSQFSSWLGLLLHLSTPLFFLLAGMSLAFFIDSRKRRVWSEWAITRFLLIRAGVLIGLQLFLLNLQHSPPWYIPAFGVLGTIGLCIIGIAFVRNLNLRVLGGLALVIVLTTQAFYYFAGQPTEPSLLRSLFLTTSTVEREIITFPVLAWFPVMLMGYIVGMLVQRGEIKLGPASLAIGLTFLGLWGFVRFMGGFGNLYMGHPLVFTKVPPDLAFLLFFLGFGFLLLAFHTYVTALESWLVFRILAIFGQTALFFYVLHERFVIPAVSIPARMLHLPPMLTAFLISAIAGVILYFLCLGYRNLRKAHPESVLKYL
ncbi:MAG: heparan-alpha-glucosaminide N-acetyltransferase domain-containing protein [Anaerolineae bacterium]